MVFVGNCLPDWSKSVITEETAQQVYDALVAHYQVQDSKYGPELIHNYESDYNTHEWAIVWEGPFEWDMELSFNIPLPPKVWVEPINHWSVAIYPIPVPFQLP
jgi:hypothetical protein